MCGEAAFARMRQAIPARRCAAYAASCVREIAVRAAAAQNAKSRAKRQRRCAICCLTVFTHFFTHAESFFIFAAVFRFFALHFTSRTRTGRDAPHASAR